jgi:hypothetical protein
MNIFRKNNLQVESLQSTVTQNEVVIAELISEKTQLLEQNKSLVEELADFKSKYEVLEIKEEVAVEELAEVVEEVKELVESAQSIDSIAATKAVEILSEVSQPSISILEDEAQEAIDNQTPTVAEQLKNLSGAELTEFFKTNKNEIYKLIKGR